MFYRLFFFVSVTSSLLNLCIDITQQTFVLMNTSWRHLEDVFCLRLQKMSSRRLQDVLNQDKNIFVTHTASEEVCGPNNCLSHTSSRRLQDVFKTSSRRLAKTSSKRLQDVLQKCLQDIFNASSRRFQDVLKTYSRRFEDISKTSSRRLEKISSRCFQDHQVKLFLLTCFQNDFEMYSKRFWDILQKRLSTEGFA